MRNSLGYLMTQLSRSSFLLFIILSFFITPNLLHADSSDVTTSVDILYSVDAEGKLYGEYLYELQNNSSTGLPIKYFQSSIPLENVERLKVQVKNDYMIVSSDQYSEYLKFTSALDDTIIPYKGSTSVKVTFEVQNYTEQKPSYILFPASIDGVETTSVKADIVTELGSPVETDSYKFSQEDNIVSVDFLNPSTIHYLQFTDKLVYKITQKNSLVNDTNSTSIAEISLPLSNPIQTFLPAVLNENPSNFYRDSEGNSFLQFSVPPNDTLDVELSGYIVINTTEVLSGTSSLSELTEESQYWVIYEDDPLSFGIKDYEKMSINERKLLLDTISLEVKRTLQPLNRSESGQRVGPTNIEDDYEGSQQDYVDLTISYLRSYGVPSYQVIGFSDVSTASSTSLDTWVKYWDPVSGWRNLDVYFADLNNSKIFYDEKVYSIELLNRGLDSLAPVYITYNLKDIEIEASSAQITPVSLLELDVETVKINKLQSTFTQPISITNNGNTIIQSYKILLEGEELLSVDDYIFPGQTIEMELDINTSDLDFTEIEGLSLQVIGNALDANPITSTEDLVIKNETFWWWEFFTLLLSLILYTIFCTILISIPKLLKNRKK